MVDNNGQIIKVGLLEEESGSLSTARVVCWASFAFSVIVTVLDLFVITNNPQSFNYVILFLGVGIGGKVLQRFAEK